MYCTYFSQSKQVHHENYPFLTRTGTLGAGTAEYSDSLIVFPSMFAGLSEEDIFWLTAGLRLGPIPCSAKASETHDHKVRSYTTTLIWYFSRDLSRTIPSKGSLNDLMFK